MGSIHTDVDPDSYNSIYLGIWQIMALPGPAYQVLNLNFSNGGSGEATTGDGDDPTRPTGHEGFPWPMGF